MGKNLPTNAGDTSLIPDPWRSHHLRATKPMGRNYWAHALEPACCTRLEPVLYMTQDTAMRSLCTKTESSPRSPQLEKACMKQRRPSVAIKKKNKQPLRASQVAQWWRIRLQMQEFQVPSLGQEDLKIFWRRKWQPIQYSCRDNPMDRGAWRTTIYGVGYDWAHTHTHTYTHVHTLI